MRVAKISLDDVPRKWQVLDARDQPLGRLAAQVAQLVIGKHKPQYVPYHDVGDHVIVTNCRHLLLSGRKWQQKRYYRHSGYVGGISESSATELFAKDPASLLRIAVKGMLPKNKLQKKRLKKLKAYADDNHPHQAQEKQ